jgi:hypothetical protein
MAGSCDEKQAKFRAERRTIGRAARLAGRKKGLKNRRWGRIAT